MYWFLIALALVIIVSLSAYAIFLWRKVHQQRVKQQALENKNNLKLLNSIVIISDAMQQEQCDLSEGCWRLSALLDNLRLPEHNFRANFPNIFALYEGINHMPILAARKELTKKERLKLDLERLEIEDKYTDAVKNEIPKLYTFAKQCIESLS